MIRILYIFLGSLSLFLGVIGIFVPGLPTTVFLLLTAALYMRSSPKLYQLVIGNKILGPYILRYRENKGMTISQKISSISIMWLMISISTIFFIQSITIRLLVFGVGVVGTLVMGLVVPIAGNRKN